MVFDQTEYGREYVVWQQAPPCPAHTDAGDSPLLCRREPGTAPPRSVGRELVGSKTYELRSCSVLSGVNAALYLFMPTWAMARDKRNEEDEIQHPGMPQGGTKGTEMKMAA